MLRKCKCAAAQAANSQKESPRAILMSNGTPIDTMTEEQERVLVVDDDKALCYLMVKHLQRRGYDVERARDGHTGFQALQEKGPFAVLVTDWIMPNMGGLELLRKARQLDPRLEVIVITASATTEQAISTILEAGAYDYLTKPLETISDLSLAVGRATAHRRLRLEQKALRD